jgi:hypothetical protein
MNLTGSEEKRGREDLQVLIESVGHPMANLAGWSTRLPPISLLSASSHPLYSFCTLHDEILDVMVLNRLFHDVYELLSYVDCSWNTDSSPYDDQTGNQRMRLVLYENNHAASKTHGSSPASNRTPTNDAGPHILQRLNQIALFVGAQCD